jgi:hypothetical protein
MSRYAWANPSTGVREQDDDLTRAIERIQAELAAQLDQWADSAILYTQEPKFQVHQHGANPIAPKRRYRLFDRIWLMFHRLSDDEPAETDPAQNDVNR